MSIPRGKLWGWVFLGVGAKQSLEELGCQEWVWLSTTGGCNPYFVDGSYSIFSSSFTKSCSSSFFEHNSSALDNPISSDLYHIWGWLLLQHLWPTIKDLCAEGTENREQPHLLFPVKCRGEEMQAARHWGLFQWDHAEVTWVQGIQSLPLLDDTSCEYCSCSVHVIFPYRAV